MTYTQYFIYQKCFVTFILVAYIGKSKVDLDGTLCIIEFLTVTAQFIDSLNVDICATVL